MFTRIMAPVDLSHLPDIGRALQVTADAALHYDAPVTYVGVTAATPGRHGHNPEEYRAKLDAFAREQAQAHGIDAAALAVVSHDPATDVDEALIRAVRETGADLVIMASHAPGVGDYFWPSNGGRVATHTDASVMLVRG